VGRWNVTLRRQSQMKTLDQKYTPIVIRDGDDVGSNRSRNRPLLELHRVRMSRRTALKGFVTTAAIGAVGGAMTSRIAIATGGNGPSSLDFESLKQVITKDHQVAPGYTARVLIRWGDKVAPDAPAWDPHNQSAAAQAKQFGYNNDFVAFFPLPKGSDSSEHGLLHVNHEYTTSRLMFPNYNKDSHAPDLDQIEMAAHGASAIEVRKRNGQWTVVPDSAYARRISVDTEMAIGGPVAGHERLKTGYDPTGTRVKGTLNNCAGGKTPWGTVLMAEENFHGYFGGVLPDAVHMEQANYDRYGLSSKGSYHWWKSVDRFDLSKEPNEPNRFGWIVEYDPYDAASNPVKRTALGRMKHEGATCWINKDGRLVVYCGDDERFEYLYRYVSNGKFDPSAGAANSRLLDHGTLCVAKFDEDKLIWLPLTHGEGPLTPDNDFHSQADVLIETRRAADLLGATPLDRPEDVQPDPGNGRVYVLLTNNTRRTAEQVDAVNPRADNEHGQVVELIPPGGAGQDADHTAEQFDWEMLLLAGDPSKEGSGASYHPDSPAWISSPDNCAFDARGRLWIATDQGDSQLGNNIPDGMYACDVAGDGRAYVKFFYGCPIGAEMCGPEFTPDGRTLFVAPQHPGEVEGSTFENPATRWPDFKDGVPPRPSVVAITKDDGGVIGG
jgi:secreted PhoX family phosphatase